jgi:hypothetical protein
MSDVKWRPLRGVDQAKLSEARVQAHFAVQWLARAARAYIPAKPDDSHTNLGWDYTVGGLTTHAQPSGGKLGLRLADMTLTLLNTPNSNRSNMLPLNGNREADIRAWLSEKMSEGGLDQRALDTPLPYEMPSHPIGSGAAYATDGLGESFNELSAWFSNANAMLGAIRRQIIKQKLDVPPVRCWPHHFDLDTLVTVRAGHTSGIGFAPGDGYYDEPYFYISMFPQPDFSTLPRLPAIGHWHSKDFSAAITPAHRIIEARDQKAAVETFLNAATKAAIKALS